MMIDSPDLIDNNRMVFVTLGLYGVCIAAARDNAILVEQQWCKTNNCVQNKCGVLETSTNYAANQNNKHTNTNRSPSPFCVHLKRKPQRQL